MPFTQQLYIPLDPFTLDDDPALPISPNLPPLLSERGYFIARAQKVLFLEDYCPAPLPKPALISGTLIFFESLDPFSTPMEGYIALAVDPQCRYISRSGFPLMQEVLPDNLISLGFKRFHQGESQGLWRNHPTPIPYFPGDAIIVAVAGKSTKDSTGAYKTLGGSFQLRLTTDTELLLRPTTSSTIFYVKGGNDAVNTSPTLYCLRNILPPALIAGSQVRFYFQHKFQAGEGYSIFEASIGTRAGLGPNTLSNPIPLLNSGNKTFALGAGSVAMSDWLDYTVAQGDRLAVTCQLKSSSTAAWWSTRTLSHASCYATIADNLLCATFDSAALYEPNSSHLVVAAEVR